MRQLFIAAACAAAALALASCDPRPLEVTDNSALKSITLTVNNDSPKWEFGEERSFTIKVNPATAICKRFELKASNPEIVVIRDGIAEPVQSGCQWRRQAHPYGNSLGT